MIKLKNILFISSALWVNIGIAHAKVSDTSCPSVETVKAAIEAQHTSLNSTTGILTMEEKPWRFEYKTSHNTNDYWAIFQEIQSSSLPDCQMAIVSGTTQCIYMIGGPIYNVNKQCPMKIWANIVLINIS